MTQITQLIKFRRYC